MFEVYEGKKVLVTGFCGFCGSWISCWLNKLGANVYGYGHLPQTYPSHWNLLYAKNLWCDVPGNDLLDYKNLSKLITEMKPDLIFHLAEKAIVSRTFKEPRETFDNNIMGTVNLLEVCRQTPSAKGVVLITSDKVYQNNEWNYAYRENDVLGGDDPYSTSKVCVEHIIKCYQNSYNMNIATARAGNVIGGGDWAEKRLIPDIVRATAKGEKVIVHTPNATRPFQHVLDALSGYLTLGENILENNNVNRAWNFGPDGDMSVLEVLQAAKRIWPKISWEVDDTPTHKFMVYLLKIDSTESKKLLGWKPIWKMEEAVRKSIEWYKMYYEKGVINTEFDIDRYTEDMKNA